MTYVVNFKMQDGSGPHSVVASNDDALLDLCYALQLSPAISNFRILDTSSNDPEIESVKQLGWGEENYDKFLPWQEM